MTCNPVTRGEDSSPAQTCGEACHSQHHADDELSSLVIVKKIIVTGLPLGLAAAAQCSIGTILSVMVSRMVGVHEFGAVSLAICLINATVTSFASGFSGALETVLSHSYGHNPNSKLYGVYAQRMALILILISFFIGPILLFADKVLEIIGEDVVVVHHMGIFLKIAVFGVYPLMILEIVRRYFACQNLNNPLSVNLLLSAFLFPFILWVCIRIFGFAGAAIAWVLLMVGMPSSLLIYLYQRGLYKKTWGGWDVMAFHNWGPLLKIAFPSMGMMLSEWASLEANMITAGYAPPDSLGAYAVWYQISAILWSLVSGVFIMAAVLVGNALGQGRNRLARQCAFLSLGTTCMLAAFNLVIIFFFSPYFLFLFSDDPDVARVYPTLKYWYMLYHFFDCFQSCMMGILRGCGLQNVGALAIGIVFSIVGVPLGIIVFFKTSMGVKALWMGPAISLTCIGFPLYMYLLLRYIPWDTLVTKNEIIPSLNSSFDRRSLRSYTLSESEAEESTRIYSASLSSRHTAALLSSQESEAGIDENSTVGSHFCMTYRDILGIPQALYHIPIATLSDPHVHSGDPEQVLRSNK